MNPGRSHEIYLRYLLILPSFTVSFIKDRFSAQDDRKDLLTNGSEVDDRKVLLVTEDVNEADQVLSHTNGKRREMVVGRLQH